MSMNTIENGTALETTETRGRECARTFHPDVNIVERADEMTIRVDLPGVHPEDVDIELDNGALSVHGTVKPRELDNATRLVHEYEVGDLHGVFQVGTSIDEAGIRAEVADGVLTLHLPKADALRPRKIAVTPA